jgi:hypothetical protein
MLSTLFSASYTPSHCAPQSRMSASGLRTWSSLTGVASRILWSKTGPANGSMVHQDHNSGSNEYQECCALFRELGEAVAPIAHECVTRLEKHFVHCHCMSKHLHRETSTNHVELICTTRRAHQRYVTNSCYRWVYVQFFFVRSTHQPNV